MTDVRTRHNLPGNPSASPYTDLFIYYLKGLAKTDGRDFGRAFIGAWLEDGFSFLFFSEPSLAAVERFISVQPCLEFIDKYQMAYSDWQGSILGPGRFGSFFITPPWSAASETLAIEKQPIILDPGVVFGSGSHPTTLSSLEALELAFQSDSFASTLDLGTGTGLLALAAARLGCPKTLAVDLNLLAVRTALNNIRLNRLEDRIMAIQGKAQDFVNVDAELIVANIHYDVMKELVAAEGFLSKKNFILSGLLRSQANTILAGLSDKPVRIIKKWEIEGIWYTFFGKIT
ncbi:MAG: 50S ribosomal protein L11 methyltransferase [Thermodesulfobacteriota bacterium]